MTNSTFTGILAQTAQSMPQLNYLEQLWMSYYTWMNNDVVATGIMSFVLHEVVYFGRCLPWIVIDALPVFRKYKLQPGKVPTAAEQWECTKLVLLSHFTVELPQIWLFHPMCVYFGLNTGVPFPSFLTMIGQIALFFVMEDTFHYFAHRGLHYGPFYKHIHKLHHKYSAPFGLAAEYAHPLEVMILGLGTVGSPILYCALRHDLHLITMYTWIVLRLFQAIDAHSGYDFPWSLNKIIPFWSGADHHDFHHERFMGNYSTSFRWWDSMLGTDKLYKTYRSNQAARKAGNKAQSDASKSKVL